MRTALVIVGTLALMTALGAAAAVGTLHVLMTLGMKYHNNYEYYGLTPVRWLIPLFGLVCFALPGIIVWRLHDKPWRVSLGTLLGLMTVVALLIGAITLLIRADIL